MALVFLAEIFGWIGGWFVVGLGFGRLVLCVLDKKLGKLQSNSIDHGGCRCHTAAMGPHTRQQSMQQSTNIICDGSTSLKLEEKILLVICLLMHVVSTWTSNDKDAAM